MTAAGKTCLVTGANSGIGKYTALELAKQQARVIMLCRNFQKAKIAHTEILKISGNPDVHILLCDLSSQEQVRQAAAKFRQEFSSLDILINNAGIIMGNKRKETEDGIEKTFAVNHLSHFMLTLLLFDLIKQSHDGRIITVSSESHRNTFYDIEDLQLKHHLYFGYRAYGISKLCNIWFTRQLAQRCAGSNIMINCLHPGFVASDFGKSSSPIAKAIIKILQPFAISPRKGAETSLYLATNDEVRHSSGLYFKDKKPVKPSKKALNDEPALQLWKQSEALTGLSAEKLLAC
jgi:NAD(P)-dependent dehydrogenase (short-subunit alcohol dehydrogenase family)